MDESPVAALFSQNSTLELYLRVEIALARAQADLSLIPVQAAHEIALRAKLHALDLDRIRSQTERTAYPIAPLVRQLVAICGEYGQYVHWGATTQDILNTALALQINSALGHFDGSLLAIIRRLAALVSAKVPHPRCRSSGISGAHARKSYPYARHNTGRTRYMMALAPYVGRLRAHDLIHDACVQAIDKREEIGDVLCRLPEVTRHLDHSTIAQLGNPMTYIGNTLEMIDAALAAMPSGLSRREPA